MRASPLHCYGVSALTIHAVASTPTQRHGALSASFKRLRPTSAYWTILWRRARRIHAVFSAATVIILLGRRCCQFRVGRP
jgi:hypothetical protein